MVILGPDAETGYRAVFVEVHNDMILYRAVFDQPIVKRGQIRIADHFEGARRRLPASQHRS